MVLQMMKIWTFFENEEQVEVMDSPQKGKTGRRHEPSSDKGEQVDNMDPPSKGGVVMRLISMMYASDPLSRMAGITLCA